MRAEEPDQIQGDQISRVRILAEPTDGALVLKDEAESKKV